MVDNKGRLFGKVSIIDIAIVVVIAAVLVGFLYRQTSDELGRIINPDTPFYVTIQGTGLRHFIIDSVDVGDVVYRRHSRQALGRVVDINVETAHDLLHRSDGTVVLAPMEGRYDIAITIEAIGSITDVGYFIGGNDHVARGSEVELVSNRVFIPTASVYHVSRTRHESP